MNFGKYVFAQLLQFVNRSEFEKWVECYKGDNVNYYVLHLKATGTSYSDLLCFSDAQLNELFPGRSAKDSDHYE